MTSDLNQGTETSCHVIFRPIKMSDDKIEDVDVKKTETGGKHCQPKVTVALLSFVNNE